MALSESVRKIVISRAQEACEYRGMQQAWEPFHTYHVEHIIARQHRGTDDPSNLALACDHRNLFKGPNLTSRDPDGDALVGLFHPRQHIWGEHFKIETAHVVGLTDVGRTTVFLLEMNSDQRVDLRVLNGVRE